MKTALITGATNGIGLEIAKALAYKHINLILVARTLEQLTATSKLLRETHPVKVDVIKADLTNNDDIDALCNYLESHHIDILVNNAGRGDYGDFSDIGRSEYHKTLMLNINALTALCQSAAQSMKLRGTGTIVNIASNAAFQPLPLMAAYAASKSYVVSLSKAMAFELRNTGVKVLTMCPGATATGFASAAQATHSNNFSASNTANAEDVGKWVVNKILKEKSGVHVHGLKNRLFAFLAPFSPDKIVMMIGNRTMDSK